MKVTVMGGGNIGTLMAAEIAHKGHQVTMYTSKPERWEKKLDVYDAEDHFLLRGELANVTSSLQEAISGAEYIWVVLPAQVLGKIAEQMLPFVEPGQKIGIVPGSGGAEFAFAEIIDKGCTLFGLQRVHSIARLREYGKSGYMLGRKPNLQIAAIPRSKTDEICREVSLFFDMPCEMIDNYLAVTLTPSNPILHTTRLYAMFRDYKPGVLYPENILFYEKWDDKSSEMLIACDEELQNLCNVIPLDLKEVKSLRDYYESDTVEKMTAKISSITAFKGLGSPMKEVENGWIPDFTSRYFIADFPFGLKIIKDIAFLFDISTPNIDIVWEWFEKVVLKESMDVFQMKMKREDFLKLYDK